MRHDEKASSPELFCERKVTMLWTIAIILVLMWLLGMITSYTLSGFIHILLVVAVIAVLIRVIQGRRL
jgi:hypothetical protein